MLGMTVRALGAAVMVMALGLGCSDEPGKAAVDAGAADAGSVSGDGGAADAGIEGGYAGLDADDAGLPSDCAPFSVVSCDCPDTVGARRCRADGHGWAACECSVYGVELSVSPAGSDTAAGTLAEPFATLERARTEVRSLLTAGLVEGGVVVWVREGVYELEQTFELGAGDSGREGAPVVYRGYPGETVRLVGGRLLDPGLLTPVTAASPAWARLDPEARSRVLELDLAAAGIADFGTLARRGFCTGAAGSALELFVDGSPMTLARWPDADAHDEAASETGERLEIFGELEPDVTGVYVKEGESDGVSAFAREGLVDGRQYRLYRRYWEWEGSWHRAWFLTTSPIGNYPGNADPWWSRYSEDFGPMNPSAGASGTPAFAAPTAINHGFASIAGASSDTVWQYAGDRPSRWAAADEIWFHGYWQHMWADCHAPAASLDPATRTVTFAQVPGYGIRAGQPYYAYNLLEELTQPGEWYLDRSGGRLYLFPPVRQPRELLVSMLGGPVVRLDGASFVELRDLIVEGGRADLVRVQGGADNLLDGVTLRNGGLNGAVVSGTRNGLRRSLIEETAASGVKLSGGDRPSLTAAGNFVESCEIRRFGRVEWTYRPGVNLSGVGHRAEHNHVHDAPHSAVLYGGNEHRIALNDIHDVCRFSSDAGAIYAGHDWGARGNVIRHNFVHHVRTHFAGYGVHGIYLDDCLSGVEVSGNVLYEIQDLGIQHGGGRDDVMVNNVIARTGKGIGADARCFTWRPDRGPNDVPGDSWNLLEKLNALGYQQEPWASRYPACAAIPNDWAAIIDPAATWLYPEGSVFSRNLGWQNEVWMSGTLAFDHYADISGNLEEVDPGFVDEAALDLALLPSSPAFGIAGFEAIPFAEIGPVD